MAVLFEHYTSILQISHNLLLLSSDRLRQPFLLPGLFGQQPLVFMCDCLDISHKLLLNIQLVHQGVLQRVQLLEIHQVSVDCLVLLHVLVHHDLTLIDRLLVDLLLLLDSLEDLLVLVFDQGGLLFRLYDLLFLYQIMLIQQQFLVLLLLCQIAFEVLQVLLLEDLMPQFALVQCTYFTSLK